MRISVVTRLSILSSFILGLPAEAIAQGGPRAPRIAGHRVSVVVPVIATLVPPDPGSTDRSWRVRTNDPALRRSFVGGVPAVRRARDTLEVTIATP